jgi:hypothetical protein
LQVAGAPSVLFAIGEKQPAANIRRTTTRKSRSVNLNRAALAVYGKPFRPGSDFGPTPKIARMAYSFPS